MTDHEFEVTLGTLRYLMQGATTDEINAIDLVAHRLQEEHEKTSIRSVAGTIKQPS